MGKVLAEAGGDVQEAIDMSVYMAGEGRRLFGQTTPSELRDKFQMSVRMPVGVRGDYAVELPIAIPAWKLAPALVCGNTVVLKPAEDTPALAERFIELLGESGLPDGVVNLVHGYGEEAGSGSSVIPTSRSSPSPARARPGSRSRRRLPTISSMSTWSSAARTRSSSSTTPTSSSRWRASSGRPSAPPGSAAPQRAG